MAGRRGRLICLLVVVTLLLVSSVVAAAPYGSRTLYAGNSGSDVLQVEARLNELGYNPGSIDGRFEGATRDAVVRFQREHGLTPDGTVGPWMYTALDRALMYKQGTNYTVAAGDTLWAIATRSKTTVDTLTDLNQIQSDSLQPGQVVRVPSGPEPLVTLPPVTEVPVTPPKPAPRYTVLGFYVEDWEGDTRALTSLGDAHNRVDQIANFALALDSKGNVHSRSYPEMAARANGQGVKVQGLVHNMGADTFDPEVARAVLSDPAIRTRTIDNLMQAVKEQGLIGLNVDLEDLPADQRTNYTAFVSELYARLKSAGLSLSLALPAKMSDDRTSRWIGAYDYQALAPYADQFLIMTYDEHLTGFTEGPVASLPWVEQMVSYAVSRLPREKVLLGIAAYGYDWKKGTSEAQALSVPQAMNRSLKYGAAVQWDEMAKVPYFRYRSSTGVDRIVYYENARSTGYKVDLVKQYGLGGIGIWRLGLEDPAIWPVIADKLR